MESLLFCILLFGSALSNPLVHLNREFEERRPRHNDDPPTMIENEGYHPETHTVTTEDGYILTMHRIPYGKNSPPVDGVARPPVLLQHGILSSSADWIMGPPEKDLGFTLADRGYDVWLGNFRGNTYSRKHTTLDPDRGCDYWEFSWDEIGKYDLPAEIDYILETTGYSELSYVGHSMGTTTMMVLMNERPDMAPKIKIANFLSPVGYVGRMKSPIRVLADLGLANEIEWIIETFGLCEFLPDNWLTWILSVTVCDPDGIFGPVVCENVAFLLTGFDAAQFNGTIMDTVVNHFPAGASDRCIIHYAQEIEAATGSNPKGNFQKFDHGSKQNEEIYGSPTPPQYYPELVNIPVAAFWGDNDWLATPKDVRELISKFPNLVLDYRIEYPDWNHIDFLYAVDADTLMFPKLFEVLDSYNF